MNDNRLKLLEIGAESERRSIAVREYLGAAPGLFWLSGYKSDMKGTKAEALARWAQDAGRAFVRFDYSGHGESSGAFTDGTIGRWLADRGVGWRCSSSAPCGNGPHPSLPRKRGRIRRGRRLRSLAWSWSRRRSISPRN